ncbi:hypothetical protein Tco_0717242 [Tanacetum coccineum]
MSGDGTSEVIPTNVTEAECSLSNLSKEDVAIENECKDGPFSNALISEMEADMHERKELGAGTYGMVYHEDGEVQMLPLIEAKNVVIKGRGWLFRVQLGRSLFNDPVGSPEMKGRKLIANQIHRPQPSLRRRRGIEPPFSSAIRDRALNQTEDSCLDANSNVLAHNAKDLDDWLIHRYISMWPGLKQEEADKKEKEQRRREKEEAEQKKELALQKHALVLERFLKKSKSSSQMQVIYIAVTYYLTKREKEKFEKEEAEKAKKGGKKKRLKVRAMPKGFGQKIK